MAHDQDVERHDDVESRPTLAEEEERTLPSARCRACRWQWFILAPILAVQVAVICFQLYIGEAERKEAFAEWAQGSPSYRMSLKDDEEFGWQRISVVQINYDVGAIIMLGTLTSFYGCRKKAEHKSAFAQEIEHYFLAMWIIMTLQAAKLTWSWYCPHPWSGLLQTVPDILEEIAQWYYYGIVQHRVAFIEAGWGMRLGSGRIFAVRNVALLLSVSFVLLEALQCAPIWTGSGFGCRNTSVGNVEWSAYNAMQAFASFAVAVVFFRTVAVVRRPTLERVPAGEYARAEQAWARHYLAFVQRWLVAPLVFEAVGLSASAVLYYFDIVPNILLDYIVKSVTPPLEAFALVLVVGVLKEQRPDVRVRRRTFRLRESDPELEGGDSAAWSAKVQELAERSISVGELLHFFTLLGPEGTAMPHYNPRTSKTNDVVRHAMIPLSTCPIVGGVSYSDVLRRQREEQSLQDAAQPPQLPSRMVTHAWDNLFLHLVASIVADALEAEDYSLIAYALALGDLDEIKTRLWARGALQKRYWVCAFCVNQHSGICAGFGSPPPEDAAGEAFPAWDAKRRDSVTGEVFPLCTCSHPKFFNDSPGQCELNKFDDMMAFLANHVPDLKQLVAVDREFVIFSRAWCVAELVQASAARIPQRVQVFCRRQFDICAADVDVYVKLATLTVAECEASRPEDKEDILARIPNVTEFDTQLQSIIFGDQGLLRQEFVGLGLLDAAVRTARRMQALADDAEKRAKLAETEDSSADEVV